MCQGAGENGSGTGTNLRGRKNAPDGGIIYDSILFPIDQASGEVMLQNAEDELDILEEMKGILESTNSDGTSLVTLLQEVQRHFGYLPREAMIEVARAKGVSPAAVFGVASFYNQFRMIPPGKHPVKMCMGTACHIKGGNAILKVWETKLGISRGGGDRRPVVQPGSGGLCGVLRDGACGGCGGGSPWKHDAHDRGRDHARCRAC